MASINTKKIPRGKYGHILRHDERTEEVAKAMKKANPKKYEFLEPSKTPLNKNYEFNGKSGWQNMKDEISRLDALDGQNLRKNRSESTCFELPLPEQISDELSPEAYDFADWSVSWLQDYLGGRVVAASYHVDEIHDYIDAQTKEPKTSRGHLHVVALNVDEDGIFGARALFKGPLDVTTMQNAFNDAVKVRYGYDYQNGTKRSLGSVDDVKLASAKVLRQEAEKNQKEKERLSRKEDALNSRALVLSEGEEQLEQKTAEVIHKARMQKLKDQSQAKKDEEQAKKAEEQRAEDLRLKEREEVIRKAAQRLQKGLDALSYAQTAEWWKNDPKGASKAFSTQDSVKKALKDEWEQDSLSGARESQLEG